MGSMYIALGSALDYGVIQHLSSSSRHPLGGVLDAMLQGHAENKGTDELLYYGGVRYGEPIVSLRSPSTTGDDVTREPSTYRRLRLDEPDVPHFEYKIAHPPQTQLVDRSAEYGHGSFGDRDLVYAETMSHPKIYPQELLCDENETIEVQLSSTSSYSAMMSGRGASGQSSSDDRMGDSQPNFLAEQNEETGRQTQGHSTRPATLEIGEGDGGTHGPSPDPLEQQAWFSAENILPILMRERISEANHAFFEKYPDLQSFGEVKDKAMPMLVRMMLMRCSWKMSTARNAANCAVLSTSASH